jgi:hypothetical protein
MKSTFTSKNPRSGAKLRGIQISLKGKFIVWSEALLPALIVQAPTYAARVFAVSVDSCFSG